MKTHNLTTEQLHKLVGAIGDGSAWPKHTDDPKVNHAVDCFTALLADDEEPEYDEKLYLEDIEAFKAFDEKERKEGK